MNYRQLRSNFKVYKTIFGEMVTLIVCWFFTFTILNIIVLCRVDFQTSVSFENGSFYLYFNKPAINLKKTKTFYASSLLICFISSNFYIFLILTILLLLFSNRSFFSRCMGPQSCPQCRGLESILAGPCRSWSILSQQTLRKPNRKQLQTSGRYREDYFFCINEPI